MRIELDGAQWDAVSGGSLLGPDGRRYRRRSTRTRRRRVDELLGAGAPLVLHRFGGGQLDWFDGSDATGAWRAARPRMTTSVPRPDGDVIWTAGVWTSDDEPLVLLTGRC